MNLGVGDGALNGWAIPTATDIAFALAVLAVISTHLPSALRTFLLTLAVVDDLFAVSIIAIFYTSDLALVPLLLALVPLGLFTLLVQRRVRSWYLLLPLAMATWVLIHESGIHATVAGVLLGFAVPVLRSHAGGGPDAGIGLAEHFEHLFRPLSAGFAVPVFAFFAAGVTVGGFSGLSDALSDRIALGIVIGLVAGKFVGVLGATYLVSRFTRASLDDNLSWFDVAGISLLAGIGFTVSLLIGDLAYGPGSDRDDNVKIGVLVGSLLSATIASALLRARNSTYRRIREYEERDENADGIPDIYAEDSPPSPPLPVVVVRRPGTRPRPQYADRALALARSTPSGHSPSPAGRRAGTRPRPARRRALALARRTPTGHSPSPPPRSARP